MNKVERAAASALGKIDPAIERFARAINVELKKGVSLETAIARALEKVPIKDVFKTNILESVVDMLDDTGKGKAAIRKIALNTVWPDDNMTLSARINDTVRLDDIRASIRESMKAVDTWRETAVKLADKDLVKADLAKHIDELVTVSRRAGAGAEYRKAVTKSMRQVQRLKETGAPGGRLKAAYKQVIDMTDGASDRRLEKAINNLVNEKMRSNAERLAITETAKAYGQQVYVDAKSDPDVVAIGYDLNDSHDIVDICDFHTGVDLYGYGKGVYPLSALPPYPFHPRCRCNAYNVYEGEGGKMDKDAGTKFLKGLPERDRRALLGVEGADSPNKWQDNLRNYQGHKHINKLMVIKEK